MMQLFSYKCLDSTMDQVSLLVQQKIKPPFAVCSDEQIKGRGTKSSSWSSPTGGIYLTIAHVLGDFDSMIITFIPIYAAVILNLWIFKSFGVQTKIKWPNDLLFERKKLAGILCETKSFDLASEKSIFISIGFGINIYSAPQIASSYESICIDQISSLKTKNSLFEWTKSFLSFWEECLNDSKIKNVDYIKKLFESYHLDETDPFTDGKDIYFFKGIENDGSMILASSSKTVRVYSANHEYRVI